MMMSPTSRPEDSAGVPASMQETTTGRDPCILKPNSPETRRTITLLSGSREYYAYETIALALLYVFQSAWYQFFSYFLLNYSTYWKSFHNKPTKALRRQPLVHFQTGFPVDHPVSDGLVLSSEFFFRLCRLQGIFPSFVFLFNFTFWKWPR